MRASTQSIYQKLQKMMPGGVSSPVRALYGAKRLPLILERACGDLLFDIDQRQYIDFCASWGALILGHSEPEIMELLSEQLKKGTSYGVTSVFEYKLAKEVIEAIPAIEMLRFCSSGTEATMFSLRLARGCTKRDYIVKFTGNYHGGADFLLTQAGSGFATFKAASKGIPLASIKYTLNLPYNDKEALRELFADPKYRGKIAAVIIEPIAANMGVVPCDKEYMQELRKLTQEQETLLIFDEVVTGFRIGLGGASPYFGVEPDLFCLGKVLGGGFPVAAYGGKSEYMQKLSPLGDIYQAGTLSGNPLAMAAGYYTFQKIKEPHFYEHLEQKTNAFLKPIEDLIASKENFTACIQKIGSMYTLFFGLEKVRGMADSQRSDQRTFWKFFNTLLDQGIYCSPSPFEPNFVMRAHTKEHLEKAQEAILDFIDKQ